MRAGLIIAGVLVIAIIIVIVAMKIRKAKLDKELQMGANQAQSPVSGSGGISPTMPGPTISPNTGPVIGLGSSGQNPEQMVNCLSKCTIRYPFNRDRRNDCKANCQ